MGTKLCNLNIYNPEKRSYTLDSDYTVVHIAEGWDTVLEVESNMDFKKIEKAAKTISKEIGEPVIVVIYFDDDIFELHATIDGKTAGFYRINQGTYSKGVPKLIEALRLDDSNAKAFRYLVKKEMDAYEAISNISAISGLPLFADMILYNEARDELIPDKAEVLDMIKQEKKKNKIKSSKPELLMELPGAIVEHHIDVIDGRIIKTVEPDTDGIDYGKIHCYQVIPGSEPTLKRIHDNIIPFTEITDCPADTNIWVMYHKASEFRPNGEVLFLQPPCFSPYETDDKDDISAIKMMFRVPEEKYIADAYELLSESDIKLKKGDYPDGYYFANGRTVNGKDLIIIGASKYVHIYDKDMNRLASYGIKGTYYRWFYDNNDLYIITSTIIHGANERGMKPTDRVRMYKISLEV